MSTNFNPNMVYRDKVFAALLDTKDKEEFDITAKVKPENREKFIKTVLEINQMEIDKYNGVVVQLHGLHTKVRCRSL